MREPDAGWFDAAAEAYDRVRPRYPDAIFAALDAVLHDSRAGEGGGARAGADPAPLEVVEIGPGTGQATGALLARGWRVTAVEPGPRLGALLRAHYARYARSGRLAVLQSRFEDAPIAPASADLVVAATAFHWVDPAVRLARAGRALRPAGRLAVIGTHQVAAAVDRGYFARSAPIYRRHRPDEQAPPLPGDDVAPPEVAELEAAGWRDVRIARVRRDLRYRTAEYADLLRSYSDMQRMGGRAAEALIAELCALIDAEFDGEVVRPIAFTLVTARPPDASRGAGRT